METGFYKWIIGRKVEQQYFAGSNTARDVVELATMSATRLVEQVAWTGKVKLATRFDTPEAAEDVLDALQYMNICHRTCSVMKIQVIFKEQGD
jgi:hypothetical protein